MELAETVCLVEYLHIMLSAWLRWWISFALQVHNCGKGVFIGCAAVDPESNLGNLGCRPGPGHMRMILRCLGSMCLVDIRISTS